MKPSVSPAREVALLACMVALLHVGKQALNFLPNIEVVTLLLIVYTLGFGWKRSLLVAVAFTVLEMTVWAIHLWVIMYIYIWPFLILLTHLLRRNRSVLFWALFSAAFGLFFGMMAALPYIVTIGLPGAVAWWASGIPFDLMHAGGNFALCLVLHRPLMYLTDSVRAIFHMDAPDRGTDENGEGGNGPDAAKSI